MLLPSFGLHRNLLQDPNQDLQSDDSTSFIPGQEAGGMGSNLGQGYKFGADMPQQSINSLTEAPAPAPVNPYADWISRWKQLNANRPNRDAYSKLMSEGEPVVRPGKLSTIGAMLSGMGSTIQEGPTAGYKLQQSIMDESQNKATANFGRKAARLGVAAGMEDKDINDQIKLLQEGDKNWRDQQEETRKQETERRQQKLVDAQIANLNADNDRNDWIEQKDEVTGKSRAYNKKTHVTMEIPGQIYETTAEKNAAKLAEIKATGDNSLAVQRERNIATNAKLAQALKLHAGTLKPNDINGLVTLDVAEAILKDPSLGDASKFLQKNALGGPEVIPDDPKKYMGMAGADSDEDIKTKEKLRKIIADSLAKRKGETPPATGASGQTSKGTKFTITEVGKDTPNTAEAAAAGPALFERRMINGVEGYWNGEGWKKYTDDKSMVKSPNYKEK